MGGITGCTKGCKAGYECDSSCMKVKHDAWQQRVIDQRDALTEDITKLAGFMDTIRFTHLSNEEQDDLIDQASLMRKLVEVLDSRIARFT